MAACLLAMAPSCSVHPVLSTACRDTLAATRVGDIIVTGTAGQAQRRPAINRRATGQICIHYCFISGHMQRRVRSEICCLRQGPPRKQGLYSRGIAPLASIK